MPPTQRLAFIDLLRGWAVIVMIETHVVNATVGHEVTGTSLFPVLASINSAVSLLFLQGLFLLLRSEGRLYRTVSVLTVVILGVTPLMWGVDWSLFLPVPLAAYLNGTHHSLFPLFPWTVFLFAGAIAGYVFCNVREALGGAGRMPWRAFGLAGVVLATVSFFLVPLRDVYPTYDYWRYSPAFVLLRLGIVCVLCAGMIVVLGAFLIGPGT